MVRRRIVLAAVAVTLLVGWAGYAALGVSSSTARAQQQNAVDAERTGATLRELLEKDLRVRRPEEFAFINRVMQLVEEGELPEKMVYTTYLWARRKPRRPLQYFELALRLRADKLGIDL